MSQIIQQQQSNIVNPPPGMDQQGKRKRQRPQNMTQTASLMKQLHAQHTDLTLDGVKTAFKDIHDKAYTDATAAVLDHRMRKRDLDTLVGRKFHARIIEELGNKGVNLSNFDKKVLDVMLLEDDFIDNLKHVITNVGSTIKPFVRPIVKEVFPQFLPMVDAFTSKSAKDHEEIRVKRRYLLTNVVQTTAGAVQAIDINPGLEDFGQWLSIVAKAYQYYRIHEMVVEYVPSTALTTQGNISYYTEVDNNQEPPTATLLPNQYKAQTHALYQGNRISWDAEELHQGLKRLHVRNELMNSEYEKDQYDVGTFYYTCTNASSTAYGQFMITLDLSFFVPTLAGLQYHYTAQETSQLIPQNFVLPGNQLLSWDPTLARTLNGQVWQGYKVLRNCTLRMQFYTYGPTAQTIQAITFGVSATPGGTPLQSAILYDSLVQDTSNIQVGIKNARTTIVQQTVSQGHFVWIFGYTNTIFLPTILQALVTDDPNGLPVQPIVAANHNCLAKIDTQSEVIRLQNMVAEMQLYFKQRVRSDSSNKQQQSQQPMTNNNSNDKLLSKKQQQDLQELKLVRQNAIMEDEDLSF